MCSCHYPRMLCHVFRSQVEYKIVCFIYLVPKIGRRPSDGPISKFRFYGENVGRSFVVCSHNPIVKTNKESSVWRQNDHKDIMQNLSVPFIFPEGCQMKIEHVLFPPFFSNLST